MTRRLISVLLSFSIFLTAPGLGSWAAAADDLGVTTDAKTGQLRISTGKDAKIPVQADNSQIEKIIQKLNDPNLAQRTSPDQIQQMRTFLQKYKDNLEQNGTDESRAALSKLNKDLGDGDKDLELSLGEAFDDLSPFMRKINDESNAVSVLERTNTSQTVRVSNWKLGGTVFTQKSTQLNPLVTKKVIYRPDLDDLNHQIVDAIVMETKKGSATEQRVIYNRRVELLLMNLKKLYYDQPSLARKITENCNVPDPTHHEGIAINIRPDARDEQMGKVACEQMVKIFDAKRQPLDDKNRSGFPTKILDYLKKLAAARASDTLDQLDWQELQSVQRLSMQFYNDNQLDTMQKMVLIELKTYFAQVTNAQVKENKETQSLDATMKDLGELQKVFDEFKNGNFQGYSMLMTTFFAKSDIEDPKYVSKDIMLLASEAFADVANAVMAQKRMLAGGLTGDEIDATIEESQQWMRLAQVHLQEFDMHTLSIQLERLENGHLRDHLGLRVNDIEFINDQGQKETLTSVENKAQAARLVTIAQKQYLPKLEQINGEIKLNLIKQSLAGFYLTYLNVSRAMLYDDTMQERVSSLAGKMTEIKDLYLSMVFDHVKNQPKFMGKSETQKLQGNLFEMFMKDLATDNPDQAKNAADMEVLSRKLKDLSQIQSADRVRDDIQPLYAEFARLSQLIMKEATAGQANATSAMPVMDDVKKEAQNLSIKQTKLFSAVGDFSAQARIFDMLNELDLYVCKYASSDSCFSSGDTKVSKAISMKWWDQFMSWITVGLRDKAIDGTMKINPLTEKAFKALGENKEERYRIMKLLAEGKFQAAIDRIAALDPNHKPVDIAIKALGEKNAAGALAQLDSLQCNAAQRDAIRKLINEGKFDEAIKALRKLDSALRAWDEYQDDKAIEDPFEMMDFDSSLTKTADNKSQIMAQGVIQNMFGQLQPYIMGYTLTAGVYDTLIVSALTLGLGAVSRYAIAGAKGVIAVGEALQVGKSAEAIAQIEKMGTLLRVLTNIGKFVVNIPGAFIAYAGKWLESSMISIRNVLGIANIGKDVGFGEKTMIILRQGAVNALKMNIKNDIIMAGASGGIQAISYAVNPESSQFGSAWQAAKEGLVNGFGFGAKSGLIVLMSPVPVSAFGEGTAGNVVRGIANSPGPLSSLSQGIAKVVATDSEFAAVGPLGVIKDMSLAASPTAYAAIKMAIWGGAMVDGALKYMVASAVAHNVGAVYEYYDYKLTHQAEAAKGTDSEGATVEMQAMSQGEAFGMTMAEVSWLLLPVHQQSNDKSVKESIAREDGLNAALNQGLAPDIAQGRNGQDIVFDKSWATETWGERATETTKKAWAKVTGVDYEPPKGRLTVDADMRERANRVEMKDMTDAQKFDIATTPRENIGKYRLKAELGTDFEQANYSNEPIKPEASAGPAKFSKPGQGGEVDVRDLNFRITDESITTAKDMLTEKIKGSKGATTRLEILRAGDSFTFNKGQTDANGESLEVSLTGKRLDSLRELTANIDLKEQGRAEKGSTWQKIKDLVTGRPMENGSDAVVRNLKNGVDVDLSKETKAESAEMDAAAKEVKDAARQLKEKADKMVSSPESVEGAQADIKDAAQKALDAAGRLEKAADRVNDPKIKMDAQDVAKSVRRTVELAESDKFTADGVGANEKEIKKSAGKLASIADALSSAGDVLGKSGSRLEASELATKAIDSVNAQMQQRIDTKLAESQKLRASGDIGGADALEREALALKATRKSVEADAFLDFVNEKMGKDFTSYRGGRLSEAQVDRSIDLFVETWEKGVFGERWGKAEAVPDGNGGMERKWTIPAEKQFKGRDGGAIPEFRGPQKEMLKEILKSMAEGNQMTMGLLKTSGGKTLLSFVLLSFMDTMARQKGKQGAVYVTVNGDLVAQAYEDYRAFFKGRDPRFEIRTVSDFMADQAMADATGGMSPFKNHDVVFDEYDLLGTITALSLGSDNGRLSHPELDPVQRSLHQGVSELKEFFDKHQAEIGRDIDGEKLVKMIKGDSPFAKEFRELTSKYVGMTRTAIDGVRGSEFKQAIMDLKVPVYDAKSESIVFQPSGLTREQFTNKYGMTPEQIVKDMRQEHDHAFGGGWRSLWDVGVIQRQQGGLDGYVTKTFLGGIQALSKPDLAKFYDAELDPTGKKLVQYHNDVPLDNLDTLYRSFLELKHGIPLTLDFDNLTVVDFAGLNQAAKESGATLVAVSGTLPEKLEVFMKDLGWNIMGEKAPGKALDYKTLDPMRKGVRDAVTLINEQEKGKAMARIDQMGLPKEVRDDIHGMLDAGDYEAAAAKLTAAAPSNSEEHEVATSIRQLVDQPAKVREAIGLMKAGKAKEADVILRDIGLDREVRDQIGGDLKNGNLADALDALYAKAGRGGKNLGFFFAESKSKYASYEAELDALNPKFTTDAKAVERYGELDKQSKSIAADMKRLRSDPNATAQMDALRDQYKKVEGELDPMRLIPKTRRVVAVTPDSNFLVQEWLMPEAVEAKNLGALEKGEADVVILIGQSGFRGLDLPFKKAYQDGHIVMFIPDPGSLSTVNRRQLTGRIDTGRMPKGATSEIVGLVREQTLLETEAFKNISGKTFGELAHNGIAAREGALKTLLRDKVPAGQVVDDAVIAQYLKTEPPVEDKEATKTYSDVRYLYQDVQNLRELSRIIKPEDVQAALKDPAVAAKLAARPDVFDLLMTQDAIQTIMSDLQAKEEMKSLEASGIFKGVQPGVLQQLMMKLRAMRGVTPTPMPAPAGAN